MLHRPAAQEREADRVHLVKGAHLSRRIPPARRHRLETGDLVGLAVETAAGARLGTVSGIHDFGAGDLVEVARDDGAASELVPFTREYVPVVDVSGGRLVVVLPQMMAAARHAGEATKPTPQQRRNMASAMHLTEQLDAVPLLMLAGTISPPPDEIVGPDASEFYGSVLPTIWSFQLALRSRGLGSSLTSLE